MTEVLILRALGLGDFLTALPALRALRREYRSDGIVLAGPASLEPLARLAACVDAYVACRALAPLPASVGEPAVAVNLHGRGPQSHNVLVGTRPRRLLSFFHPEVVASRGGPVWRDDEHEVARWSRMLEAFGIAVDPTRLELPVPRRDLPRGTANATLIHPGAASGARRWPAACWAEVARQEAVRGPVFVTGGPSEVSLAQEVARQAGLDEGAVLAGRTDLLDLTALVAAAGRVACGDTGVAHLATAVGTPSVVLFGPTSPALWGPPDERPQHRVIWKGRVGDPHAAAPAPGLLEIGVEEVVMALRELDGDLLVTSGAVT